jgi:hypothetical protein
MAEVIISDLKNRNFNIAFLIAEVTILDLKIRKINVVLFILI